MIDYSALENNLDNARQNVKTESYSMSIGEIVSMYERDEIILRPEYQRYFRWDNEQKSKLIESILIGLPLPLFYISQDADGKWEVVDGMQRLSTIFDFIGELKPQNKHEESYKEFTMLSNNLFYLKDFSNKGWGDFSRRLQLDFKRTKIQLIILMRETDRDAKFELFQRLNSGGTLISGQELRNAILARDKPELLSWFEKLSKNDDFVSAVALAKKDKSTRYDMELVLRFMILISGYYSDINKFSSVDIFITHMLYKFIDEGIEQQKLDDIFQKTFKKINELLGPGALKFKKEQGHGKFSIAFFEAVALGIAQNIDNLPSDDKLKEKINLIGSDTTYQKYSGAGKNAQSRIPKLMELGRSFFNNGN